MPKILNPIKINDLRKISGTPNLSLITEKVLSQFMINDMKPKRDMSQYGNEQGLSINHYLIKMFHTILSSVDNNSNNEINAVLAQYIDWSQAFDRQCPTMSVQSFIDNGVRISHSCPNKLL